MSDHDVHQHPGTTAHGTEGHGGLRAMAIGATLHCLTGCAIGEIAGLIIGTTLGFSTLGTIALAVGLAFFFGYSLSTLPLIKAGLPLRSALVVVLAADTLSIATMEVVDNAVMTVIPGAMDAGLGNPVFWVAMSVALVVAFFAAYPVNRFLLRRGKGHALTHRYHGAAPPTSDWRRFVPDIPPPALAGIIAAFMLGGLLVAATGDLASHDSGTSHGSTQKIGHFSGGSA